MGLTSSNLGLTGTVLHLGGTLGELVAKSYQAAIPTGEWVFVDGQALRERGPALPRSWTQSTAGCRWATAQQIEKKKADAGHAEGSRRIGGMRLPGARRGADRAQP
jgi:hypothetical protein